MRPDTLIFILVTAITVYFVTSSSNKTTGKVPEYSETTLPEIKDDSKLIEDDNTPQTLNDLSLPQLLALDAETGEFLRIRTVEEPEETAEWALLIENEFARFKVLRAVLHTWAEQSPKTCAFWIEQVPPSPKSLDLYITVARSWASSAPTSAIEEYRSINSKTKKPKYGEFVIPLTKAILDVWAQKSPELAASWVTQNISDLNERKLLYPVIMHAWFNNSYPNRLFSWLIQFKYDEIADLDSIFLMKEWVMKDSTGPFEWLSKQLSNEYINELSDIAAETLADKELAMCVKHLNNPAFSNLKKYLVQAIIVKTAGVDDKQALTALSKLNDLTLVDSIARKSAMQLVGRDEDAILYVKATGFLTFTDLEAFFMKWSEVDPRKVMKWLKQADYNEFSTDLFDRMVKEWNLESKNNSVSGEIQNKVKEYLSKKPDLLNKPLPVEELPKPFKENFQKAILSWNTIKVEIVESCAALWAARNFEEALSFALADSSTTFTVVCLRGILPLAPDKSFDSTYKKLETLDESYPVKKIFSYLALSKADNDPKSAIDTLKKKGMFDSEYVIQTIDLSIKEKREELENSLNRLRIPNIHIYFPYYFYQYTRIDPENAYKSLQKYSKRSWYNSGVRAIAASYKDHHSKEADKWLKSLKTKEKEIAAEIIK